jgi:hypothetical protein
LEWWLGRTASHLAPLRTAHSRERYLQYDVFKSEAVDLNLKDDLEIKELKLTRTYSWNDKNNELNQNGIIKIKKASA